MIPTNATIQDGIDYVNRNLEKGVECPCCNQTAKIYRYKLYDTSARALIRLYRLTELDQTGETEFHIKQYAEASNDYGRAAHFAELRFWGLIEKSTKTVTGKRSSGFWSITEEGKKFVKGETNLPKNIRVFNNQFFGFEGEKINIRQALGLKFNYDELMS